MTKKINPEDKINDHLQAIIILHTKLKRRDEFYYRAYVGAEIERLIKTLKKCKPCLLKNTKNLPKKPINIET